MAALSTDPNSDMFAEQTSSSTTSNEKLLVDNNETVDSPPSTGGLCGVIPGGLRIKDLGQKVVGGSGGLITKLRHRTTTSTDDHLSSDKASLYDPSLYNLCDAYTGALGEVIVTDNAFDNLDEKNNEANDNAMMKKMMMDHDDDANANDDSLHHDCEPLIPASIIGNPNRKVCIVTTAALPWRTGTAVNPLLRALYLVRFQNEERSRRTQKLQQGRKEEQGTEIEIATVRDEANDMKVDTAENNTEDISYGSVTLVIPWLESQEDRIKLYGPSNAFPDTNDPTNTSGTSGQQQQEEWIRGYSTTRCQMPLEAKQLKIIFYPAFYLAGFGSIFPKVDLCNFIPSDVVDVAILEEPEHLNWFRMPNKDDGQSEGQEGGSEHGAGEDEALKKNELSNDESLNDRRESGVFGQKVEVTINDSSSHKDDADMLEKHTVHDDVVNNNISQHSSQQQSSHNNRKYIDKAKLGWTHRFNFVVGIVHTNYEAYARQYGIGASLIAAPTVSAMSALTIRAYCHQVIKLSDTLPSFAPGKELTCNVHGVRREFLEGVDLNVWRLASSSSLSDDEKNDSNEDAPSPVYFIGKLVWAKGFDHMLELQDIFRKRNKKNDNNGTTGGYFHIDIYGGGPDEKAIARAFHGRHHKSPTRRPSPKMTKESMSPTTSSSSLHHVDGAKDLNAAAVLANPQSIKDQSSQVIEQMKRQTTDGGDDVVSRYLSLGFEVCQMDGSATYVKESRRRLSAAEEGEDDKNANPLDVLGDLSEMSFDTGVKTSRAVYNIADSSIKNILTMSFSQLKKHPLKARMNKNKEVQDKDNNVVVPSKEDGKAAEEENNSKHHFVFDPPASRYEWRRHPIPAKFPGVIDHAQLKNMPYKIFLNPSTSEVLCTTTAEALAMNKFVIIPKHPSNDFFLQFTNCLSYDTLDECADKMAWALENIPTTLSEEERRKFTWEAATERLMESSIVTVKQAKERAENGMDKTDARIAFWLSESAEKSNMIRNLFHKNHGGSDHSPTVDG
mmetsp:Transcript_13340/g.28953  ORF Transcript_13340/g.28953 Transcript_13340/m.28953 type:complete len:1008 (-) Transcript_13340:93-3116(-)|eukprot:CAMPEP_0172315408 /NCGR_PEP_ID=MMETSP1058-20130122/25097_1 /TAXON_ID=83371 /ORGANISM="Detonula confervacea, Strain CCMP 353" /LENGTH=1007 /DNA_ID=CAMNT_0013029481 /DNA_START=237 /DNA_END=3260 /DNA_ORIENTATION=+